MTAAVVVNHRAHVDARRQVDEHAAVRRRRWRRSTRWSSEAMGFSKERGDSLNVVNAAFNEPSVEAPVELPLWKQPDNIALAKEIGRYLLLRARDRLPVLRRACARCCARRRRSRVAATPACRRSARAGAAIGAAAPGGSSRWPPAARPAQLARDDPKIVANVVKEWVSRDE